MLFLTGEMNGNCERNERNFKELKRTYTVMVAGMEDSWVGWESNESFVHASNRLLTHTTNILCMPDPMHAQSGLATHASVAACVGALVAKNPCEDG
jgi:hypothetical protein